MAASSVRFEPWIDGTQCLITTIDGKTRKKIQNAVGHTQDIAILNFLTSLPTYKVYGMLAKPDGSVTVYINADSGDC